MNKHLALALITTLCCSTNISYGAGGTAIKALFNKVSKEAKDINKSSLKHLSDSASPWAPSTQITRNSDGIPINGNGVFQRIDKSQLIDDILKPKPTSQTMACASCFNSAQYDTPLRRKILAEAFAAFGAYGGYKSYKSALNLSYRLHRKNISGSTNVPSQYNFWHNGWQQGTRTAKTNGNEAIQQDLVLHAYLQSVYDDIYDRFVAEILASETFQAALQPISKAKIHALVGKQNVDAKYGQMCLRQEARTLIRDLHNQHREAFNDANFIGETLIIDPAADFAKGYIDGIKEAYLQALLESFNDQLASTVKLINKISYNNDNKTFTLNVLSVCGSQLSFEFAASDTTPLIENNSGDVLAYKALSRFALIMN